MDDLIPGHIIQYIKQLKNLNVSKKTVSSNEGVCLLPLKSRP